MKEMDNLTRMCWLRRPRDLVLGMGDTLQPLGIQKDRCRRRCRKTPQYVKGVGQNFCSRKNGQDSTAHLNAEKKQDNGNVMNQLGREKQEWRLALRPRNDPGADRKPTEE